MAQIELKPFNFAFDEGDLEWPTYEPPVTYGDGDLTDDSDASYVEIGAWRDTAENEWVERVSCDFATPPGVDPSAVLLKMRARNSADILASPPTNLRLLLQVVADTTTGTVIHNQQLGNTATTAWPLGPLTAPEVVEPAWFTWYWQDFPDMADPTDNGYWLDFALFPAAKAALTGGGLRVTLGWYWPGEPPYLGRRAWLDVFEVRLIVEYANAAIFGIPPLRQVQRGDGLGFSSAPRAIQNNSVQGTLRNFGFN